MPTAPAPEVLTAECRAALAELGPTEIVVAVHTVNRISSIAEILNAIDGAIAKHLPSSQAAVLVADPGMQDGSRDAVRAWCGADQRGPVRRGCVDPAPPVAPGRAVIALLAASRQLGARSVAVVDADLAAGGAEWLPALIHPVADGRADYVTPAYSRLVSEGTLTTNLLAPLTRALYGRRIQQVTGGCAALAAPFLARCLDGGVGIATPHAHGIEIALTTAALAAGVRIGEAHLGRRFVDTRGPQLDLATTLVRTVGPVFDLAERYRDVWEHTRGSTAVPWFGEAPAILPGAQRPAVDAMVRAFGLGMKDLLPIWEQIMPEATLAQLYPLALLEADQFEFAPALWARVVVDFAVAHHERRLPGDHLVRALTPLYLGRVAAFLIGAWAASPAIPAEALEQIGRAFETEKEGLAARWR